MALFDAASSPGRADVLAPLILAGMPTALSVVAAARTSRIAESGGIVAWPPVSAKRGWLVRFGASVALALLLASFGYALLSEASFSFDFGLDPGPITPLRLLPGPSEAWAYLVALPLTAVALTVSSRAGLAAAGALVAAAVVGGAALAWYASLVAPGPYPAVSCHDRVQVVVRTFTLSPEVTGPYFYSTATGHLDGTPLGLVGVSRYPGTSAYVNYDTRWGHGSHYLAGEEESAFTALRESLRGEDLVTADDLGIDSVEGVPVRHCQVVIDGRSAVRSFFALRWLTGANETTSNPGAGLEAWRGLLDYWIVPAGEQGNGTAAGSVLAIASVAVDGQPPGWLFPGVHSTLRASLWFGYPFGYP